MACKKPGMRNYVAQAAAHFHHLIVGRGSGYGDGATVAETSKGVYPLDVWRCEKVLTCVEEASHQNPDRPQTSAFRKVL